ncbi:MAG: GLPGLI family protein [Bacteroidales bacterium]|nr:GLPGLI family protein [Bacteroidales bacterium]
MVRKLLVTAFFALSLSASFTVYAQNPVGASAKPIQREKAKVAGYDRIGDALYEVIYEYRVRTTVSGKMSTRSEGSTITVRSGQPEIPEGQDNTVSDTYSTILQFGTERARFLDYLAYKVDSLACAGAPEDTIAKAYNDIDRSAFYFDPVIFQNWPEGSMTVDDVLVPGTFTYSENMTHEWTFGDDQKEVCGYPCQEAKTSYGGREWTVWFAPSIPSNVGPWKLGGLPGLILEAQDAEGIHHFTATALRKAACPIVRVQDAGRDKTQRDRFIQRKKASGGNSLNNIPTESITSIAVFKNDNGGTIKVNGRVTVRMTNHTWIPLELE